VDIGDPWNPNPTTVDNIMKMLEGIHKVLKPDGIFVSITFGQVWEIQLSESLFQVLHLSSFLSLVIFLQLTSLSDFFYFVLDSHTFVVDFLRHLGLHGQSNGAPLVMASITSSTPFRRFSNFCLCSLFFSLQTL
jgi:hypothetical protein